MTIIHSTSSAHIAAQRFAAAFRSGSADKLAACFTDDGVLVHPMFGRVEGRDNIAAAESSLFGVFDQVDCEVVRVIDSGEWATISCIISARQCADIVLPDGSIVTNHFNHISLPSCDVVRVDHTGLIIEAHRYQNPGTMFSALMSGTDLPTCSTPAAGTAATPSIAAPDAAANIALVKAAYESGDLHAIADRYAIDATLVHPIAGILTGRHQIAEAESALTACFSDLEFQIERVIQEGWWAAAEMTGSATHTGPFPTANGPIPATGRRVVDHVVQVFRLAPDGRMAYAERSFDAGALLNQLTV